MDIHVDEATALDDAWRILFEDRYGAGSVERLMAMLERPCVTFARIASEFGVTRECVRLWHQRFVPDAPRGQQRQQLCREHQMKRSLLEDALFLRFYRHVRSSVPQHRVTLIPSRDGFRKRTVSIDGRTIALRRARRSSGSTRLGRWVCQDTRQRSGQCGSRLLRAFSGGLLARAASVPSGGTRERTSTWTNQRISVSRTPWRRFRYRLAFRSNGLGGCDSRARLVAGSQIHLTASRSPRYN